jgi:hypothetical protein
LSLRRFTGKAFHMGEDRSNKMSREERLAAKLRENLRRRKVQAREFDAHAPNQPPSGVPNSGDGS